MLGEKLKAQNSVLAAFDPVVYIVSVIGEFCCQSAADLKCFLGIADGGKMKE